MLDDMTISSTATQIGLVVIGWPATSAFYLNNNWNKTELISHIQALKYVPQWTHLAYGLNEMTTNQFTSSHGGRRDYPDAAVVLLTTKADQGQTDTLTEANEAWAAGITVYSVGLSDNVDQSEIQSIASPPHLLDSNYFLVQDSTALPATQESLKRNLCSLK